jgi:hypothetical protein
MNNLFRSFTHPFNFHASTKRRPFFEQWYYKLVDSTGGNSFVIVPGVYRGKKADQDHAYIQILDGRWNQVVFQKYPIDGLQYGLVLPDLRIGSSRFTPESLKLDFDHPRKRIYGEICFGDIATYPSTVFSPGVMDWYMWVPFLQCYHSVINMDHSLQGNLVVDRQKIFFDEGRGCIEKNWGSTLPSAWVWYQSNHFSHSDASLSAAIATVPRNRKAFAWFYFALNCEGELYTFTSYDKAEIEMLVITKSMVKVSVRDATQRMTCTIQRGEMADLYAPTPNGMTGRIPITMEATVDTCLSSLSQGKSTVIFNDIGRYAGLGASGDIPFLLSLLSSAER